MKKLIKNIANNKIRKDNAINSLKEDSAYMQEIKNLNKNSNSSAIINTYTDFVKYFGPDYFDKTDDKANNEGDNEEIDTTYMPNLETEESAEQRRKQEAK